MGADPDIFKSAGRCVARNESGTGIYAGSFFRGDRYLDGNPDWMGIGRCNRNFIHETKHKKIQQIQQGVMK